MIVGAAAHQPESGCRQRARQCLRIRHNLALVLGEARLGGFLQAHRFGGDDVHQRSALNAWKHRAIEIFGVLLAAQDQAAARAAQRLVRRRGDEIGVRHRTGVNAGRDQSCDVRHVGTDRRANTVGARADPLEIDRPRIRAGADNDHLWLVLGREAIELVVVDPFVVFAHAVRHDGVQLAGEIERVTVREMPPVRQIHAEHGVSRLQQRHVHGHVRLRARMRLHIRVIGTEERDRTCDRRALGDVDELAAAVVPLTRIPFGVLVRHHRTGCLEDRAAHEVLGRDELEAAVLPVPLVLDRGRDFRIGLGERSPGPWCRLCSHHRCLSASLI